MKPQNKLLRKLGTLVFFAGALLGIAFFTALTWPDLEAKFYFGYNGGAETKLPLTCPQMVTPQDSSAIVATITNKVDRPINPRLETEITGPIMEVLREEYTVEAGQTRLIEWPVGADNLAFGHLIMAQAYQFASYKTPTATATCGALFLNIPFLTGFQIYLLFLILSLVGIVLGIFLWLFQNRDPSGLERERLWGMIFLSIFILLGIIFGSMGLWIPATLVFFLCILMFVVQLSRRLMPS